MLGRRGLHLCLITDRPQHPVLSPVTAELSTRHRVRVIDPDSVALTAMIEAELKALAADWPREPVIVQKYIPNDGWDRKLYVIDDEIFGLYRPSPLTEGDPEARISISVPAEWASLAERVRLAFDLRVYGLDL